MSDAVYFDDIASGLSDPSPTRQIPGTSAYLVGSKIVSHCHPFHSMDAV